MPSKMQHNLNKLRGKLEDNTRYTENIAILSDKFDALLIRIEIIEQLLLHLEAKL